MVSQKKVMSLLLLEGVKKKINCCTYLEKNLRKKIFEKLVIKSDKVRNICWARLGLGPRLKCLHTLCKLILFAKTDHVIMQEGDWINIRSKPLFKSQFNE